MEEVPTITKRVIDGGRNKKNFMFEVIKNSSGYTKQSFSVIEFYCNTGRN